MSLTCIFLDRDGVINRERADYVKCWEEFEFLPGVFDALSRLATLPIPIIVISNQSAIGRGHTTRVIVDEIHRRAQAAIEKHGGRIDEFFICPHHPNEACTCRKPNPGMLHAAAEKHHIDLQNSVFIGDAMTDYQAACAAGSHSILLKSGRQGDRIASFVAELSTEQPKPLIAENLSDAVNRIVLGEQFRQALQDEKRQPLNLNKK